MDNQEGYSTSFSHLIYDDSSKNIYILLKPASAIMIIILIIIASQTCKLLFGFYDLFLIVKVLYFWILAQ